MPYMLSQILPVITPTIMQQLGRDYVLGNIHESANSDGYNTLLYSPRHLASSAFSWSRAVEVGLTEAGRIDFATSLLRHAVETLDRFVADEQDRLPFHAPPPLPVFDDPVVDVDFS